MPVLIWRKKSSHTKLMSNFGLIGERISHFYRIRPVNAKILEQMKRKTVSWLILELYTVIWQESCMHYLLNSKYFYFTEKDGGGRTHFRGHQTSKFCGIFWRIQCQRGPHGLSNRNSRCQYSPGSKNRGCSQCRAYWGKKFYKII